MVYAAADLGIEEGQGRHGVGGLLPGLCLPDLHDEGALEVSVLLALQIKAPKSPSLCLPFLFSIPPRVPAELKGEAGLLLIDPLVGVPRLISARGSVSAVSVVRVPVFVPSPPGDLVNPGHNPNTSSGSQMAISQKTDLIKEVFVVHDIRAPSQYYR